MAPRLSLTLCGVLALACAPTEDPPELDPPEPSPGGDPAEDCVNTTTHPRVGESLELTMRKHDVRGTVTITSDCVMEVTNFAYDGGGPDARFYGALEGEYEDGFAMTGNLKRKGGYDGEVVYGKLPAGKSWDDVDGVSLWCVDFNVSFGDGEFD